jgi:hypothetical protein
MNQIATLLHKHFATNQSYFLEQQKDGTYSKKCGQASIQRINRMLTQRSSIAILQRNKDRSVKWICFDFDIKKEVLTGDMRAQSEDELKNCTYNFCQYLEDKKIPHILEFSGNRGFHVWITFHEPLAYFSAYCVQQSILKATNIDFNENLLAIDLFPRSHNPSGGIGSGVKIPLSLHAKSGMYARLLRKSDEIFGEQKIEALSEAIIDEHIEILSNHTGLSKQCIEDLTGISDNGLTDEDFVLSSRITHIKIAKSFSLDELISHWKKNPELETFADRVYRDKQLNNNERKLLVGLLSSVEETEGFSYEAMLHKIFAKMENYDQAKTATAISTLSSFHFPSRQQIEAVVGKEFQAHLTPTDLINICIPNYLSHVDNTFKISENDVEITRLAELNYIRTNDEVHAKKVANSLTNNNSRMELYYEVIQLISKPDKAEFYIHERQEPNKIRKLITLNAAERVASSAAMKQIIHYFDWTPSINSYGYSVNRGFKGGHIFTPWLSGWNQFTENIETAISDAEYSEYYIIKSDIRSFYDDIPHDNIKRVLLEGASLPMKAQLISLTTEVAEDYKSLINLLFGITKSISEESSGLPQGPAYARWLAELYISSIDAQFDQLLRAETVLFYQRFVDDIFFITPDEASANIVLQQLRRNLEALGLQINDEKTVCKKIKDFTPDFDKYRSQSKYVVDKVSRGFEDATEGEKDNAVGEILKLVQSDTYSEDLAFIFSHLTGVELIDKWKREQIVPILSSKQGRGSLFRHLFNFALDDSSSWPLLQQIEIFSDLQSEVLTEVLLDYMHEHKSCRLRALELLEKLRPKISKTPLALEHLAFVSLYFGHPIDSMNMPPRYIVDSLRHINDASSLQIPKGLVDYINTELNGVDNLDHFIHAMYCLCAAPSVKSSELNGLAGTFFAKFSYEERTGGFSTSKIEDALSTASLARLYYLICLFSISKAGSIELVKSAWKYCLSLCNNISVKNFDAHTDDWLRKIEEIDIDNAKALLILSSIVDGNIIRDAGDNCRLFERYHSTLLIYFALGTKNIDLNDIKDALEQLAKTAKFYAWLTLREDVTVFPNSNKSWFDKNLIENDVILLKKGNELLMRRPTEDFCQSSSPENIHLGFSELIIPYDPSKLASLKNILDGLNLNEQLRLLCDIADEGSKSNLYPNFFQSEPIISLTTNRSLSLEFNNTKKIVFEGENGDVTISQNNKENFIRAFLKIGSKHGLNLQRIDNKYIKSLDGDAHKFLSAMRLQLERLGLPEDNFSIDLAAASAIYTLIDDGDDDVFKVRKFVNQYHKFHPNACDQIIYAIDDRTNLNDSDPLSLLESVSYSLSLIRNSGYKSLFLYVDKDIQDYANRLERILSNLDDPVSLKSFQAASVKVMNRSQRLIVNGNNYHFNDVSIVHSASNCLKIFTQDFSTYISSSEQTYFTTVGGKSYLLAIDPSITRCYRSLESRVENYSSKDSVVRSFPTPPIADYKYERIDRWSQAVDVLQEHREVSRADATQLLAAWLKYLPPSYHEKLVTLIASHEVMKDADRQSFLNKVEALISSSDCVFWLKHPEDFNGTQRILYCRAEIGRNIKRLSPLEIKSNPLEATVVVDLLVSGSQTTKSLKYYMCSTKPAHVDGCYPMEGPKREELARRFDKLSKLHICCVLYTSEAINFLKQEISTLLGRDVVVDVIQGRNIDGNAFFETTNKIGINEKSSLREFLLDKEVQGTFERLFIKNVWTHNISANTLGRTNLVARYQSVPKKCFWFLPAGLRADEDCSALLRIAETPRK